ncbi:MAG: aldehyde dehydrogenase family protein [Spartobacteria bacterium]|nr:aldehyde dehydrogenase family protein [Spartobacteria bacterium]
MTDNVSILKMREFFADGGTRELSFRRQALHTFARVIEASEAEILAALKEDLGKPTIEAYASEAGFVLRDIRYTVKHLRRWARPAKARVPPLLWPGRARVIPEPRGVALIIGPWNYPFQLALSPLIAAVAAGNCAVVKPSEYAPKTSAVIRDILAKSFDGAHVRVVEGDHTVAARLLEEPFDYIFFTGGTETGRKVMAAAARRLTPVTLELGGKNPAMVCADADIRVAARRIARGKFMNAGQTCVATDHVWVDHAVAAPFMEALTGAITSFYGAHPEDSPDYGRIISARHVDRLAGLLEGQAPTLGGAFNAETKYVAPTLLLAPAAGSPVMQEEIFGPILPVIAYSSLDDAVARIRAMPPPLALYIFSSSRARAEDLRARIPSGGVCVNDTVHHLLVPALPFGGLGASGMGAYHGRAGFDTFTHWRSVMTRGTWPDGKQTYPPFSLSLNTFKKMYRWMAG